MINRIRGCFSGFLLDERYCEDGVVWSSGVSSSGGASLSFRSSELSPDVSETSKMVEDFVGRFSMLFSALSEPFPGKSLVVAELVAKGAGQVIQLEKSLLFR